MKASTLSQALKTVSGVIPSRPTLPVLKNVYLGFSSDKMTLAATDLETFVVTKIPSDFEAEHITIPGRLFNDFVATLDGDIDIEVKGSTLVLGDTEFNGIPGNEFPLLPQVPDSEPITFESSVLASLITNVLYARSGDDARPTLKGVVFEFGENLTLATADGYRMAMCESGIKAEFPTVIIPGDALVEVVKILNQSNREVNLYSTDTQMFFEFENTLVVCQLLEGTFVNYRSLLPQSTQVTAIVNSSDLKAKAKRANVFASKESGVIHLEYTEDGIKVSATAAEYGNDESFVNAEIEGEHYETALNATFLLDALSTMSGKVVIEQDGANRPFLLYSENKKGKPSACIMPMFVKKS